MTRLTRLTCLLLVLSLAACASSPTSGPQTSLAWSATVMRADAYFNQGQMLDALPLYEQLAAKEPKNPRYAERVAACLVSKFGVLPTGKERARLVAQARSEAERAEKLGDNSNYLRTLLDYLRSPNALTNNQDAQLQAAEALFAKGDMDGALAAYKQIASNDASSYPVRLYAGDVYFRKRDYKQAGEWFAQAIQIDPNRETAYRYWGDALTQAGDNEAALQKFVDAVVAEPYARNPWMGLTQWAQRNHATVVRPNIVLPKAPETVNGKTTIHVDDSMLADPASGAAWLAYSAIRATWQAERFKQEFPAEKQYRHSLSEEVSAIQAALLVLKEETPRDSSLSALKNLQSEGMLEAYILLSAPDDGIASDYDSYRNAHRAVLHEYLVKHAIKR
jgi:tetratricopeptide (TPR) repeat protein